jgi:hypothetical protein
MRILAAAELDRCLDRYWLFGVPLSLEPLGALLLPPAALPEELPEDGVELVPPLELGGVELELGADELDPDVLPLFFSLSDEDDGGVLMPELEEDEEPGEDGVVLELPAVPPVEEPLPEVAPLLPPSLAGWSQP